MKNFIVLSDKRTGSSFLMEALSSHKNIKCYDEMFLSKITKTGKRRNQYLYAYMKKKYKYNISQYLDWLYDTKPKKSVGFRIVYPQDKKWKVLDTIIKKNIPVIHLIRENLLKMVLSKKTKGLFEVKEQYFNPDEIIADIKNHENKQKEYFNRLKKYDNVLNLKYEDIIGRTEGEKGETKKFGAFNLKSDMITYIPMKPSKKICEFLEEEPMELYSNVTKKNKDDPWLYIENKEEIKETLKKKGYSRFIE